MKSYREFVNENTGAGGLDVYSLSTNPNARDPKMYVHGPAAPKHVGSLKDFYEGSSGESSKIEHHQMVGNPKLGSEDDVINAAHNLAHISDDEREDMKNGESETQPEHLLHKSYFYGDDNHNVKAEEDLHKELQRRGFDGIDHHSKVDYEDDHEDPVKTKTIFNPEKHLRHVRSLDSHEDI